MKNHPLVYSLAKICFNNLTSFILFISFMLFSVDDGYAQFSPGKLAVVVVGDGSTPLTSAAAPVFVKEFDLSGSSQSGTIRTTLPSTATTGNFVEPRALTQSGTGTSEGFINLSVDRQYLTLTGYNSSAGFASVATSSATTFPTNTRVIGSPSYLSNYSILTLK